MYKFDKFITKRPVLFMFLFSLFIGLCLNVFMSMIIHYIHNPERWNRDFNDGKDFGFFKDYNFTSLPYSIIASMIFSFILFMRDWDYDMRYLSKMKNELLLNLGLRKLYKKAKRLPKFICKHCLKTIIVKNLDIVCPFCDANFTVTDEEKSRQMGDVFAKGVRNLVNESTMEKILFVECPACNGKIRHIDCYHCGKELDLFEEYNEYKLEKKRYE